MAKTELSWAGLLDEVLSSSAPGGIPVCSVAVFMEDLEDSARVQVAAALEHPRVNAVALAKSLRARGFKYGEYPIKKHRQRKCACFREDSK
jgi:hypothetical protein